MPDKHRLQLHANTSGCHWWSCACNGERTHFDPFDGVDKLIIHQYHMHIEDVRKQEGTY